jgi:hypothetical protein
MPETNINTEGTQGAGTQTAGQQTAADDKTKTTGTQTGEGQQTSEETKPEAKFTQDDLDAIIAKRLKRERETWDKQAKMTEDERLKDENSRLQTELRMRDAKDEVTSLLNKAGAKSASLLFGAAVGDLEFDSKTGKVTNAAEIVSNLLKQYPEQFGTDKPTGSADGGAGKDGSGAAVSMNDLIRKGFKR